MGFDRNGFNDFIRANFSYDGTTQRMIDNLVEYGMEHLDNFDGQLVNFIQSVIDDPTLEEIKQFEIKEEKTMNYKTMNYKTMRDNIGNIVNENHKEFVKAIISIEKGINDESALDKLYDTYMENSTMNLLYEEFDYMIESLREQGQIKDIPYVQQENNDPVNIVGNIVGQVSVVEKENKNGEIFNVVNFSIVSKDDEGNKIYHNCSAYGEKGDIPKDFKKGDFVKLFGRITTSMDENGKERSNLRVLYSKMLKAKEHDKTVNKEQDINELRNEIEEREKDLFHEDSSEQHKQISADIKNTTMKPNNLIKPEKNQETDKPSILEAIKKHQAEEKEKPQEKKEASKEVER